MENTLNMSKILLEYFTKNRTRKAALARKLQKDTSFITRIQKRNSLQTQLLLELCHALQHNFFQDLAASLPSSYSSSVSESDIKDNTITQLQEEIKILKAEKEVLLQVLRK